MSNWKTTAAGYASIVATVAYVGIAVIRLVFGEAAVDPSKSQAIIDGLQTIWPVLVSAAAAGMGLIHAKDK